MSSLYPEGHALVVGVAKYETINSLPDIVLEDARSVVSTLTSRDQCGYLPANVAHLIDGAATKDAILKGLRDIAAKAKADDTVCFYFSGHGGLVAGGHHGESSLLPVDCDIANFEKSSISTEELSTALHEIKAERLIVFLDACHAEGAGSFKGVGVTTNPELGITEKTLLRLAEGKGRVMMASSKTSETSLIMGGAKNSAFTQALLEGLGGAADGENTGVIKVFDLFNYIAERVPLITGDRQHPIFKAGSLEKNFPVALSKGGINGTSAKRDVKTTTLASLQSLLPALYPSGPADNEIWTRAGGDISRLKLQGNGRAIWYAALRILEQGGGGSITVSSLIGEAVSDFPNNEELANLSR